MTNCKIALYEIHTTGLLPLGHNDLSLVKKAIQLGQQIWIDVIGIDPGVIQELAEHLNLHQSIIKDIIYLREQRPKVEVLDDYVYWISREHQYYEDNQFRLKVFTIVGENFVVTIRESKNATKRF